MSPIEQLKTVYAGEIKPKTIGPPARFLLVKELADALGVSPRFVYQMRARGFPMRGYSRQRQGATLEEARDWINAHGFRLSHGVGIIDSAGTAVAPKRRRKPKGCQAR
ncbi:MAG: hypothetical protein ACREFR_09000 [Limisphaerales bacterium]